MRYFEKTKQYAYTFRIFWNPYRNTLLDHNPPHFHAKYQNDKVIVEIKNGKVKGEISERALRLILEWLDLHREELLVAWQQAAAGIDPEPIEPLK